MVDVSLGMVDGGVRAGGLGGAIVVSIEVVLR